ncbi:MAG: shikimate dehydrogenase [Zoogloeaceae bacterium]|jgi:shikimate dehydrogenase|nr:shikimate dehydrogenase [Zoogloeaceae bacterium]
MKHDRYAVFGNPVAHSLSPRIHAAFAAQAEQDMTYEAIHAPRDGFAAFLRRFVAEDGRGANVTVPFKEEAFRLCDILTPRARDAGAVNTLSLEEGVIQGDNTDGVGLVHDIEHNLGWSLQGKRILLIGAGGAARGVLPPLLGQRPARLMLTNRTPEKAEILAEEFVRATDSPLTTGALESLSESFDIVINATSASLANAPIPLPNRVFAPDSLAYDIMYGRHTPFLEQAGKAGASVLSDGLGMLVEQAAESFYIWRGLRPVTRPVLETLRAEYR